MNACAECGKPLPTPPDEYGPVNAPLCMDCFLSGANIQVDKEISRLEILIENLRCDITAQMSDVEGVEDQIEECRNSGDHGIPVRLINLRDREEKELYRLREKLRQAQDDLWFGKDRERKAAEAEKVRLVTWKEGHPC
jgi:hypothetical protein